MALTINDKMFWKLPYEMRRAIFKKQNPHRYKRLIDLRKETPEKLSAATFKPFLDTQSIFVHIPKAAGISVGYSLYGRHTGNHTTVAEYQMAFSRNEFNTFFKFCFVRNPWDRLLSAYLFMKNGGRNKGDRKWADENLTGFNSFNHFVLDWLNTENANSGIHFKPQNQFITTPNSLPPKVNFVGFFENIENDWEGIRKKMGVKSPLIFNNKTESKKKDYRSYYNNKTIEIVASVYHDDIALFGYSFENETLYRQLEHRDKQSKL